MNGKELLNQINSVIAGELFSTLYGKDGVDSARRRYNRLIEGLLENTSNAFPRQDFPETAGDLHLFSVPGRTELGGNHTDHNNGKVLAASIQLDAAAVAAPRPDKQVLFRSVGHRDVKIDLSDLSIRESEKGDTEALIRGIAAEFAAQGTPVGGFTANADNMVLTGSGLSSSAAVEVLFAKIFDDLFCGGKRSALELAKIGQKAENLYFGKPCGLMDQIACATGGAVAIDFEDTKNPKVKKISFDPAAAGFALCVVDTKGKHSDLTPDYAAIPTEMKAVAAFFGKTVLRELDENNVTACISDLRKAAGDRALLRAFHFFGENRRVDAMLTTLENLNTLPFEVTSGAAMKERVEIMKNFLTLAMDSGASSLELLQNIYSAKNPALQGVGLALEMTKKFLVAQINKEKRNNNETCDSKINGACRVHGGGFAGTIQAYIPLGCVDGYCNLMEEIFGKGTVTVLKIRPLGAIELDFS